MKSPVHSFGVRLLWNLAPKFDQHLRQSGTVDLEPWQQEIRDYVSTARKPTFLAQKNLVEWGKRKGLLRQAPARLSHWATDQPSTPQKAGRARSSKPSETGLRNR